MNDPGDRVLLSVVCGVRYRVVEELGKVLGSFGLYSLGALAEVIVGAAYVDEECGMLRGLLAVMNDPGDRVLLNDVCWVRYRVVEELGKSRGGAEFVRGSSVPEIAEGVGEVQFLGEEAHFSSGVTALPPSIVKATVLLQNFDSLVETESDFLRGARSPGERRHILASRVELDRRQLSILFEAGFVEVSPAQRPEEERILVRICPWKRKAEGPEFLVVGELKGTTSALRYQNKLSQQGQNCGIDDH
ncbi:hypothetical protein B0H14DRAFT_3157481 [Mycena olivaceomarginata]|nr:hypothetical protein B0H14DRAFT_3157481 [Mycena olivaceomarginata]